MTKQSCKKPDEKTNKPSSIAVFLKDSTSTTVIPTILNCYPDGTGTVGISEEIIGIINKEEKSLIQCIEVDRLKAVAPEKLAVETHRALQKFNGDCPKEDRSCGEQLADMFMKDIKNSINLIKMDFSEKKTDMGCLSTLFSNLAIAIVSTIKLFLVDIPKKVFEVGKSLWNYMWGKENESSTAMLYSSVMAPDMAQALADWDLAKFYSLLRKNFFDLIGNIRKFYSELLGCTQWQGAPYASECLKKTNWSCPTCESVTNFTCGLLGQIGAGAALGGLLGTGKAIANVAQLQKAIQLKPKNYGLSPSAISEMKAKMGIDKALKNASDLKQRVSYKTSKYTAPLTDFLETVTSEIKVVSGLGSAFKKVVTANPVTLPYHLTYQAGKGFTNRNVAQGMINRRLKGAENSIDLGKRYALHLQMISDNFAGYARQLYKIRGDKFNQAVYKDIMKDYIGDVAAEMKRMGIKSEKIDGGMGLKLTKGDEVFEYRPDFTEKLQSGSKYTLEDFKSHVSNQDPILYDGKIPGYRPDTPGFLSDIIQKADTSKGLFVTKADAMDGYVYLGHFSSQQSMVPDHEDCNDYLDGLDFLDMQNITVSDGF